MYHCVVKDVAYFVVVCTESAALFYITECSFVVVSNNMTANS
jgi:hypothetical protein